MRNIYFSKMKLAILGSFLLGGFGSAQVQFKELSGFATSIYDINNQGIGLLGNGYYDFATNTPSSPESGVVQTASINEAGQVLGLMVNDSDQFVPAFRNAGVWTMFSSEAFTPGTEYTLYSISENGVYVCGQTAWTPEDGAWGFMYNTQTQEFKLLNSTSYEYGAAYSVNNNGIAVGWVDHPDAGTQRLPAIFHFDGTIELISEDLGEANGINDNNMIVGQILSLPFVYDMDADEMSTFTVPTGYETGAFTDISMNNIVVGYAGTYIPGTGFYREPLVYHAELGDNPLLLKDVLNDHSIDTSTLSGTAYSISPDGNYVAGFISGAAMFASGWAVYFDDLLVEGGGGDECSPVNVPYYQDFESAVTPEMPECTTVENAGAGNNWHTYNGPNGGFTGTYLRYQWNSSNAANSWFYTQGVNLTAGTAYKVSYDYGSEAAAAYPESLKVAYGTENTHTAMTNVLAIHENFLTAEAAITNVVEFTPTTSGVYYFGFNAFSNADMFYMYLDNIKVELAEEIAEECEWTITVEGPFFGDEISWEFRGADGTVLLSGGEYDDIGFSDVQTISAAGPVEFYIEAFGNFDDNEVSYEIKNANGIQASGSLDGGDDATHSDMNCDDEGEDPTYCIPDLDCTDGDVITNVVFQEINNPTSCSPNGYGDYTSMIANVEAGNSYPINVTVGSGWAYESVSVWIDYNNNMVFEESEFTYVGTGSGSVVSGNIAIPAGTADGEYRMRVRVAAVGETSATWDMACDEDQGFGETEDYTVNVGTLGLPSLANNSFAYYPNPTTGLVNISSAKTIENVQVYNLVGQEVLTTSKVANGQINVQMLPAGTYVFRVALEGGQIETFKVIKK
ncbi:GEVED domain-containing protein [Moheibacter stercoris]|uniref:Por secretion system C-terminal sorting domain-containing protein n=1 Tax=Moheibacter stercoris TaxID=1628251 RepID=A0ABV2LQ95_9FLAO